MFTVETGSGEFSTVVIVVPNKLKLSWFDGGFVDNDRRLILSAFASVFPVILFGPIPEVGVFIKRLFDQKSSSCFLTTGSNDM